MDHETNVRDALMAEYRAAEQRHQTAFNEWGESIKQHGTQHADSLALMAREEAAGLAFAAVGQMVRKWTGQE